MDRGEGREAEAELVAGDAGQGSPVGEEVELLLLDRVLHVAPQAVDALVDGPGREGVGQRGRDEAGVGLAGQVLGTWRRPGAGGTSGGAQAESTRSRICSPGRTVRPPA